MRHGPNKAVSASRLTPSGPDLWHLSGVLDFSTVTSLTAEAAAVFRDQAARGLMHIEIDLSGLESANSAGLALLLEWLEMAHAHGIRLVYRHLPDSLNRIAMVSNLQTLLPLAPDLA